MARGLLGVGESAGVPAAGKLNAIYLEPKDRAIGAALTQVGIALGGTGAPILVGWFTGWRSPFFVCAALGLGWIPLWMLVRRAVAPWQAIAPQSGGIQWGLLSDARVLRIAAANGLWMVGYVLWSTFTTLYFTETFHMTQAGANGFAWFPPVASTVGAFVGGGLSRWRIHRGASAVDARRFAILVSSLGCLIVALAPYCRTPVLAVWVIAASYFWTTAGSVNLYTIPVDLWGGERAGTAISALVCSYGLLQLAISPGIGMLVDRFGFGPVCWLVALPPLGAWMVLRGV
jgi:ACS family hexuronate transporter-like MFS transporter